MKLIAGEEQLVTTIREVGAIAARCRPDEVQVDMAFTKEAPAPAFAKILVEAPRLRVEVRVEGALDTTRVLRGAVRALCRVVARRTPKAEEVSVEASPATRMRTVYKFTMLPGARRNLTSGRRVPGGRRSDDRQDEHG